MSEHITRILGIAPYESMKISMQNLAKKHKNIHLDVFVGDLEEGVKIVRQNLSSDYDVIISRGGTAQMITKITTIPVVEINMSVYDVLRAIKLVENYSERYAVIGFPAITQNAHLLCDLLQYKMDIFTIHNELEVMDIVKQLKNDGYRMLLCDMIASTVAKKMGLNAILITSGVESIESAFDQAIKLSEGYEDIRGEINFLKDCLKEDTLSKVIFNKNGEVVFSSWNSKDEIDEETAIEILKKEIDATLASGHRKIYKNIDNKPYTINGAAINDANSRCAAFYLNSTQAPLNSNKYGLSYSNRKEVQELFFNSFYSVTETSGTFDETIARLAKSTMPVMITGEPGTGKAQAARAIYIQSALSGNPLITIDFDLINDKTWEFLINHYNSPLNDNNNTIYIKNADKLSEERLNQLLSTIIDMKLVKKNRLILSCVSHDGVTASPACLCFVNTLGCLTLNLAPLRDKVSDIPTLSSLYLGTLNVELALQIIGFEQDAMALIQEYDWPGNQTQFKRVLRHLATITTTSYIRIEDVEAVLKQERSYMTGYPTVAGECNINLNRTLEDITSDIICRVLIECGNNQSAAAKRLGISRTTLWRYLKR